MYITILGLFERGLEAGLLNKSADGFDKLLDVVAPRLSRAVSRAVPEAFQRLWVHFKHIGHGHFSEDARAFLNEVAAAAPELIPETQEDPVESLIPVVDTSTEYDADMSASLDKPEEQSIPEERPAEGPIGTESSPAGSIAATDLSSQAESVPSNRFVADVFGPASIAPEPVYKKRGRKRGSRCESV